MGESSSAVQRTVSVTMEEPSASTKHTFFGNVLMLAGGATFSQLLIVLASPILTRLYAPDDFGVFSVFSAYFSILLVIAPLRYDLAVPLPDNLEDSANLVVLALFAILGVSLLSGAGCWIFSNEIAAWSKTPELMKYLWLLPISLPVAGLYQVLTYWTMRQKEFGVLSYTKTFRAAGQVAVQIASTTFSQGPTGLIAGFIAGQFCGIGPLLRRCAFPFHCISINKIFVLAKEYKTFPLIMLWAWLADTVGLQLPIILFSGLFGIESAGQFSLSIRCLAIPSVLVGQAVAQVLYASVTAKDVDRSRQKSIIEQSTAHLFIIAFVTFSLVALHGPLLFGFVFGTQWIQAGHFGQLLAPWCMISFITGPISLYALAQRKESTSLLFSVTTAVLRLSSILVAVHYESVDLAVLLFSIGSTLMCAVYFAWVLRLADSSLKVWLELQKNRLISGLILLLVLFVLKFLLTNIPSLILSGTSLALYATWFSLRARRPL